VRYDAMTTTRDSTVDCFLYVQSPTHTPSPTSFEQNAEILLSLPDHVLATHVAACFEPICGAVAGAGNPDLFGIGVFVSYALQFALALLYGPFLLVILVLAPVARRWRQERRRARKRDVESNSQRLPVTTAEDPATGRLPHAASVAV